VIYINIVENIIPSDDAFHGSPKRISAEWWYFDAILNNDYSIHIGFRTISKKKIGFVMPFIEIYKNGDLKHTKKKRFLFKNFKTSKDIPLLKLFNKPIIEFDEYKYKEKKQWIYKINYNIDNLKINLIFKGLTNGFKVETKAESWTVALPKAEVFGEIIINEKKMIVEGIGYHDHNWNYSFLSALTYGKAWYWGKITTKNYNIVWANVIKKSNQNDFLAIICKDQGSYFNINPEKINFETSEYIKDHRRKMPTKFKIIINDKIQNNEIKADIEMKVKNIHFNSVLSAPYWRYHIKNKGYISINQKKEIIDNIEIMEYLKFS
jgi:predicted secreted hydrolase